MSQIPPHIPQNPVDSHRSVGVWLLSCAALVGGMILLGGATRLTDSGLSIVDWKPLTGFMPPLSAADWQALFDAYKQTSEFQKENFWMTVDDFKSIYWLEYLHRLAGRLIGIFYFLPFLWFLVRRRLGDGLWWRCFVLFLLGGAQGFMGWYMVKSGLADRTDVSQYRLAAHLSLALIIYICLLWLGLKSLRPRASENPPKLYLHAWLAAIFIFITVVAGAFVAGIDAGKAYNSFPMMDGRYVPDGWLQMEPVWINFFENTATVQFVHRQLAIATVALVLLLWFRSRWSGVGAAACRVIDLLCAFAVLQLSLGIATVLTAVPLVFGLMHQAGAVGLLSFAVWTIYELGAPPAGATGERRPNRTAPRM